PPARPRWRRTAPASFPGRRRPRGIPGGAGGGGRPGRSRDRRRAGSAAGRGRRRGRSPRRRRPRAALSAWGRTWRHIGWPAMSPPAHPPRPRVAFLGPPGTFSEEALLSQADLAAGELVPIRSIPEVIAEVDQARVDLAVVPIENAIEGSVTATLDTLAFDVSTELLIQREIVLPIDMHLCVPPGTGLADVTTVVSIPHATAQCRDWLSRKLPGVAVEAANSTAEAAQTVAGSKSKARGGARAAISTALAAQLSGRGVRGEGREDHA